MKQIFTFGLVLLACIAQAGNKELPFGIKKLNPKVEKLIKETRLHMTDAQLRIAASGFPDSALVYSWDGAAWELETQARINYTNFGKISSMIFFFDLGGTSIPVFSYQYTYDAAGRTTRIEQQQTLPGMPPVVAARFTMNYDAQGNQTSMLIYEDDNGTLRLSSGDSMQITYNGAVPSQATRWFWDESLATPAWAAENRFSNLAFDANGQPTALTISYSDNGSFVEEERFTDVSWKMGYPGFSLTFGGLIDIGQFLFQELPVTMGLLGEPSDYVGEIKDSTGWVLYNRVQSTGPVGAITQLMEQLRDNNTWVDDFRSTLTYTSGRLTMILGEFADGATWNNVNRDSWTFDAQGNITEEKSEFYSNNTWSVIDANRHTFSYTADNKVYRWINESWDMGSNAYVNAEKRDYFFGSFPQSVVNQNLAQLRVYPNPVQDVMNISLESAGDSRLSAEIYNLQGQLVQSEMFTLTDGKNQLQLGVETLAHGMYQIRLTTATGMETIRFVK